MAKKRFNVGDNVQLKSGGPHMTIVGYTENGQPECCWFDNDEKERRTTFPEAALVVVPADKLSAERLEALIQDELLQQKSKAKKPKK